MTEDQNILRELGLRTCSIFPIRVLSFLTYPVSVMCFASPKQFCKEINVPLYQIKQKIKIIYHFDHICNLSGSHASWYDCLNARELKLVHSVVYVNIAAWVCVFLEANVTEWKFL